MIDPDDISNEELESHRRKMLAVGFINAGVTITNNALGVEESGHCAICERDNLCVMSRRLNTAYHDEQMNWLRSCEDCYNERIEHYRELWNEYYRQSRSALIHVRQER